MQHFQKPENALRRADELYAVGQKEPALVALHDVLSSKRHRTWQPMMEEVMKRFLTICVEMRRGKASKDGLIQYRIICQQMNVNSLEAVLRHFMQLAHEGAQAALELAEKTISDKIANLLDFDDLEAEETPESLMLATIGGSADSKKRTDRLLVTPALKFLWEAYRTVLDILRNNSKLEELYRDTAAKAFAFCKTYNRAVEFRRLCEMLRNHIHSQTKVDPKWRDREPPTPEALQVHLETRFGQLATAVEMELWQEAYRTVEDVHSLTLLMKRPPKPSSMAAYHAQLAQVFWVAGNSLFHAYALVRSYATAKSLKTAPSEAELTALASRAVLAALSVPPSSPVLDLNLLEYDLEHEKTKRMAQMLSFPSTASRATLLAEVVAGGLLEAASPEARELYALVERKQVPLDLAAAAAPVLAKLAESDACGQYDLPLRRLIALRMLQQMERLYLTISIDKAADAITVLQWPQIEALLVWAVKKDLVSLRIDYKLGQLNQQRNKADAAASSEVRESLAGFASALDAVNQHLRSADLEKHTAEARARLQEAIGKSLEEEHQKVLARRVVIERRKEEQERVAMEEDKEKSRLKAQRQRAEEEEEKARLQADAERRDAERETRTREEAEAAERRKLAEQMAEQRKTMKVAKKKGWGEGGGKVETDVDKLAEKDRNELMREQKMLLMDERQEFEKRLESMGKRHDHLERARREEERELLELRWQAQQAEDKKLHEANAASLALKMKESRAHDLQQKARFSRMAAAADAFTKRVLATRAVAHEAVVAAWRVEQSERREAARRERERVAAEEREREAAIEQARREAEEEEARRIQEAQEAARKKQEAEEERKRVLERQKAREKELEEKEALARLAAREQAGKWGRPITPQESTTTRHGVRNGRSASRGRRTTTTRSSPTCRWPRRSAATSSRPSRSRRSARPPAATRGRVRLSGATAPPTMGRGGSGIPSGGGPLMARRRAAATGGESAQSLAP